MLAYNMHYVALCLVISISSSTISATPKVTPRLPPSIRMAPRHISFTWNSRNLVLWIFGILKILTSLQGSTAATMNPCADIRANAEAAIQGVGIATDGRLNLMVHDQMIAIPLEDTHILQNPGFSRISLFSRGPGFENLGHWTELKWLSELKEKLSPEERFRFIIFPNGIRKREFGNLILFNMTKRSILLYNHTGDMGMDSYLVDDEFDEKAEYYPYSVVCGNDAHCYILMWDSYGEWQRVVIEPEPFYKEDEITENHQFTLKIPSNTPQAQKVNTTFYHPEWYWRKKNYLNFKRWEYCPRIGGIGSKPEHKTAFPSPVMPGFIYRGRIHLWDLKQKMAFVFDDVFTQPVAKLPAEIPQIPVDTTPFEDYFSCDETHWDQSPAPFTENVLLGDFGNRSTESSAIEQVKQFASHNWHWFAIGVMVLAVGVFILVVRKRRAKRRAAAAQAAKGYKRAPAKRYKGGSSVGGSSVGGSSVAGSSTAGSSVSTPNSSVAGSSAVGSSTAGSSTASSFF